MAVSPAHRFGQIIGEVLEAGILPILESFAKKHGLYLDKKGVRPARTAKKVNWTDRNGNKHDLDFVLERGGTAEKLANPLHSSKQPGGDTQSIRATKPRKFKGQSCLWSKNIAVQPRSSASSLLVFLQRELWRS